VKDVICSSTHPEDIDTGRVLAIGETAEVDETSPHNAHLIEEGRLTLVEARGSQTIDDILASVGDDPAKALAAIEAENATSRPRSTLLDRLQVIANPDQEGASA
jgi:hypothetical protein